MRYRVRLPATIHGSHSRTAPRFQPQEWAEFYAGVATWSFNATIAGISVSGQFNNLHVGDDGPDNEGQIVFYSRTIASGGDGSTGVGFEFDAAFVTDTDGYYVPTVTISVFIATSSLTNNPASGEPIQSNFTGTILGASLGSFYGDNNLPGSLTITGQQWWECRDAQGENPIYNQNDGTPERVTNPLP